ncbi:MAG: DUF3159 domain-containing protein [Marmoricola sp.]
MTSASAEAEDLQHTAEEFVRSHLARALGGKRGMVEAGVPTAAFTATFLLTHDLVAAISAGAALTLLALVIRLVERSSVQYALNAAFGIAVGAFFAYRSARHGGSVDDQALAYFLPGVLFNIAYAVGMVFTVIIRWPLVGFMIGGVLGDPLGWREKRGLVVVCSRLTLCLAVPCVLRALVQGPLYLAGHEQWMPSDAAVSALGVAKLAMGWPLQVAAFAGMAMLLGRSRTPMEAEDEPSGVTAA